ncbi:alpha/beta hydrolase [Caballeronia sp. J97]|uniref:alpha/beta fold hydrolase n=1 Tax=Caballeronia sp. J97 TaxID=2805429 RepID=UPI002AB28A8A|nr:alpha/beta hydrolase [Caballeronia sp. J97]
MNAGMRVTTIRRFPIAPLSGRPVRPRSHLCGREVNGVEKGLGTSCANAADAAAEPRSTLVLIPGTLCDQRVFGRQIPALRAIARVRVADLSSMKCREQWLNALIDGLPERFSVAGFSLGGMFALELLRRVPERIERVALIASNAQPGTSALQKKSRRLGHLWRAGGARAVIAALEPSYFHRARVRYEQGALLRAMAERAGWKSARAQFAWAAERPAGYGALAVFGGPTLILSGAHDSICTRRQQRLMAAASRQSHWIELSRCGHFLTLEEPAKIGRALARWMREPVVSEQGVLN